MKTLFYFEMQLQHFKFKFKVTSLHFTFVLYFLQLYCRFPKRYLNSVVIYFHTKTLFYVKYVLLIFHKFKIGMSDVEISVKRLIKLKNEIKKIIDSLPNKCRKFIKKPIII